MKNVSRRNVKWSAALIAGAVTASGARAGAQTTPSGFGTAIVGGNFNGVFEQSLAFVGSQPIVPPQAGDEFAIGSPEDSARGQMRAGIVYVYVRNNTAMWSSQFGSFRVAGWTPFVIDQTYVAGSASSEQDDVFGSALAVGDFNGDGKKDLAVGAPGEDIGAANDAGTVHILFGADHRSSGTLWPFGVKATLTRANAIASGVFAVPMIGDGFGSALAAGDFNGDGFDDLAVGAPGVMVAGSPGAGAVIVFPGSASGFGAQTGRIFYEGGLEASGALTAPALDGESFGQTLAAGNFNSDSNGTRRLVDLAVGAPQEVVGSAPGAGKVIVFYGATTRLNGNASLPPQIWTQSSLPGNAAEPWDGFGTALAVSNFNRGSNGETFEVSARNFDDLAIGTPWEDLTIADAGMVQVLYGYKGTGLRTTAPPSTDAEFVYWRTAQSFDVQSLTGGAPQPNAQFGAALVGGEVLQQNGGCQGNACNPNDLVVGEPYHANVGRVWILDGQKLQTGLTTAGLQQLTPSAPPPGVSLQLFGKTLGIVRLGLGRNQSPSAPGATAHDLFVGAPMASEVYAYFGHNQPEFSATNIAKFPYAQSPAAPAFLLPPF